MFSWFRKRQNAPGVCFDECKSVLLEAENIGKTLALCSAGSAFEQQLGKCNSCVYSHQNTTAYYNQSEFQQYINYCDGVSSTIMLSATSAFTSPSSSASSTYLSTSAILSRTGSLTPGAVTVTVIPSSTATVASIQATSSAPHHNWIAGAVIGPVFLVILAVALLYLSRKKLQRAKQMLEEERGMVETKAQLHSDDIKPTGPVLLMSKEQTAELPANELVGSELNAV